MSPLQCSSYLFSNLRQGGGTNHETYNLMPEDKELDDAIFEIFKEEQINMLKRKYNIQCINDIVELKKKKKTISSNVIDEPDLKAKSHAPFPDLLFGSKLQRSYGHILPSQVQADICQCIHKYSTETLDEQTELMVFSLLDVLCNHFATKDSVKKCSMNIVDDSFVTPKPNDAACKQRPPLCSLDLNLDIATSQHHNKKKANNNDIISDTTIDLQKKPCGKAHDRIRGVNYAPDTYSPTPCNDSAIHSKQYAGPSGKNDNAHTGAIQSGGDDDNDGNKALLWSIRNSPNAVRKRDAAASKALEDVIDLADDNNDGKKSIICSLKTPSNAVLKFLPASNMKSPEVKFIGEKKLKDKLNSMVSEADSIYNENLAILQHTYRRAKEGIESEDNCSDDIIDNLCVVNELYSSKGCKENFDDIHQFESSKNFPLTKFEILIYITVCKFANLEAYHNSYACEIGGVHVKYFSLVQSLAPGGEVGSFVMNVICRKFFLDERPTSSMKHYFFSHVGDSFLKDSLDLSYVKKCFAGAASVLPLRAAKMLFFPICHDGHWFVFIVELKKKLFVILDSFYSKDHDYQITARKKLLPRFIHAWEEIVKSKVPFDAFRVYYPVVPKQSAKTVDCGIFAVKFMERWTFNADLTKEFYQDDISNIRVKILNELFLSPHNVVDVSDVKKCAQEALSKGRLSASR